MGTTVTPVSQPQSAVRPETENVRSAKLSDQLDAWLASGREKTLGSLVDPFGDKSFAVLLVLLLAVPALPVPTGGLTHVFEIIAVLLAVQLILGRNEIWLPNRWRDVELEGPHQQQLIAKLLKLTRRLEHISRPRLRFLFHQRATDRVFGLLVIAGTVGAFLAPPFSGLDTLPALGVVLLSLSMLLEDFAITIVGLVAAITGIALELALGAAAIHGLQTLL